MKFWKELWSLHLLHEVSVRVDVGGAVLVKWSIMFRVRKYNQLKNSTYLINRFSFRLILLVAKRRQNEFKFFGATSVHTKSVGDFWSKSRRKLQWIFMKFSSKWDCLEAEFSFLLKRNWMPKSLWLSHVCVMTLNKERKYYGSCIYLSWG